MLIDRILQRGITAQMLPCLMGVDVFQRLIQPHLCPALVIFILTRGECLGCLPEICGCLCLRTATAQQLTHLVATDGERHLVARLLQYRYGAFYRLFCRPVLLQCYLCRCHLRQSYAHSCSLAQQRIDVICTAGIVQRPHIIALGMIHLRCHAVAYRQQVRVVRLLTIFNGFENVFLSIVELLRCQTDACQCVERTAHTAFVSGFLAYIEAFAHMPDGILIVRQAEMEQSDEPLAVASQRCVAQLICQRQSLRGISQTVVIVLCRPQMFARPIPHQHIHAVGRCPARHSDAVVGCLLAIQQVENLVGGGKFFFSFLSVIHFQQVFYCVFLSRCVSFAGSGSVSCCIFCVFAALAVAA